MTHLCHELAMKKFSEIVQNLNKKEFPTFGYRCINYVPIITVKKMPDIDSIPHQTNSFSVTVFAVAFDG